MGDNDVYSSARLPYEHPVVTSFYCTACDKPYSTAHHLDYHQRSGCAVAKRNLTELLEGTNIFWQSRKKRRGDGTLLDSTSANSIRAPSPLPRTPSPEAIFRPPEQPQGIEIPHSQIPADLDIPVANRKRKRTAGIPTRYKQAEDVLPGPCLLIDAVGSLTSPSLPCGVDTPALGGEELPAALEMVVYSSDRNAFGVARSYRLPRHRTTPLHDPDQFMTLDDVAKATPVSPDPAPPGADPHQFGPFNSRSAFSLAEWYWQSSTKSFSDFQKLLSILKSSDFSVPDVIQVDWKAAFKALGSNKEDLEEADASWIQDDGWKRTPISINIPFHKYTKDPGTKSYAVGVFHHRSIVSVIKEKVANRKDMQTFHYYPYRATWQRAEGEPESELYGEMYSSQAFRVAHNEVQRSPITEENRGLERVVIALMFWSDATQLTSFGGSSLWPCYLFFGNESKHQRGEPSNHLGQHIAYFLKLPDRLNDHLKERNQGKLPTEALFTYCKKDLFHKQWSVLLDRELVDAMRDGLVLRCPDGHSRCFYPRIFTYSADYPEKALISGMRNNGGAPCHRCLVKKSNLFHLGAPADVERTSERRNATQEQSDVLEAEQLIQNGYAVNSDKVEDVLKWQSLVPRQTAFARELHGLNFHLPSTLVVDILHEFEIGVWKTLYVHLLRLLEALSTGRDSLTLSAELDARYRATPAFGRDTIRKFPLNASQMRRKAARDYEDLLQCAIPAFETLLPPAHNAILMPLLYICAQWHALAKLRLHNDSTLNLLEYTTTILGAQMRRFHRDTCLKIATKELQKEAEARSKREEKQRKGSGSSARKPAALGIFTIKFHFLGDYAAIIRKYGTTDSFSTQTGELYHRDPKAWFIRTDKKEYEGQMSHIERRQSRLSHIRDGMNTSKAGRLDEESPDPGNAPAISSNQRYSIGGSQNIPLSLNVFLTGEGANQDPYLVEFIPKLKRHLLPRLLEKMGLTPDDATQGAWTNVSLQGNRIYSHKTMRLNYTTYDVRRDQDVIHLDTPRSNIMLLNSRYSQTTWGSEPPYLHAKVLGIFHANVFLAAAAQVLHTRQEPSPGSMHKIEFLWVQWYTPYQSTAPFSLDRVVLRPPVAASLDFLEPTAALRAAHLVPHFSLGKARDLAPTSRLVTLHEWAQWKSYYVNKFVDRDMFMRFQFGMSVGHTYMHAPSFPAAAVPTIPPDFDHCLDGVLALGERGAGVIPTELTLSGGALQCGEGTHEAGFGDSEVSRGRDGEEDKYEDGDEDDDGGLAAVDDADQGGLGDAY